MANRTVSVNLVANIGQYVSGMNAAAGATLRLGESATASSQRARSGFDLASKGALLLGAAVVGGMALAISKSMEFEKAMSAAAAATSASGAALGDLRDAAMEAGAATQYSATEAAQAITEMGKAGVSTADILDGGLNGALALAAAGQLDVAKAAEIASVAMTQFKLSGDQLPHVADLLAAGAGKAMGSVEDLGMALNQSGLVASAAGLSIEETTGTLAAFASAGLVGSDAGTSLKTMLQKLQNPSKESAEAMAGLGISMYNAQGQFVGMESLAGQLQSKMQNLTPAVRDAAMAQIFGSDAVRAANVLYAQGATGIADWTKKVNDSGYAAEVAAKLNDNLAGDLERLGGAFDTLLISIGSGAQGPLRSMTRGLTDLIDGLAAALDAGKDLGSELAHRLAPFMGNVGDIAGNLWKILGDLVDTVGPLAAGIAAIAASAIISGLTTLSEALSAITGFLADNEEAAFALAAVLGVQLAGGVAAVTVAFNRMILTPVVLGMANVLAGAGSLAAFLTGGLAAAAGTARAALIGLMTAAAPLAAVAAVAAAVVQVVQFSQAAGNARDEIAGMWDAVDNSRGSEQMAALSGVIDQLKSKIRGLKSDIGDIKTGLSGGLFMLSNGADIQSLNEYEKALDKARLAQAQAMESAAILGNQFGLTGDQVLSLADKYGIDLTGSVGESKRLLENFYTMEFGGTPTEAMKGLQTATEDAGAAVGDAQKAIDAFKLSLDILTGAHVSMIQVETALGDAVRDAKGAVDGLDGSVLNADGSLNTYSESGSKASDVLLNVRDRGGDLIATMIQQGKTAEEVAQADAGLRDSFIRSAMQMNISETAANALADQILGIPSERRTKIDADTQAARDEIAQTQRAIDLLRDRTVTITTRHLNQTFDQQMGRTYYGQIREFAATGGGVVGGHIQHFDIGGAVRGLGGPTADRVPAMLSNGEHVWTAREVDAAGGQASVAAMRRAVLSGREFSGGGSGGGSSAVDINRLANNIASILASRPTVGTVVTQRNETGFELAERLSFTARTGG